LFPARFVHILTITLPYQPDIFQAKEAVEMPSSTGPATGKKL